MFAVCSNYKNSMNSYQHSILIYLACYSTVVGETLLWLDRSYNTVLHIAYQTPPNILIIKRIWNYMNNNELLAKESGTKKKKTQRNPRI